MAGEMFGAPAGIGAAIQDQFQAGQAGLQPLQAQEMLGRIAMQPAQARLIGAEASQKEMDVARQQRMMAVLSNPALMSGTGGTPLPLADRFAKAANFMADAGDFKSAADMSTAANHAAEAVAQAGWRKQEAALAAHKLQLDQLDAVRELYNPYMVVDQVSLDAANLAARNLLKEPSPFDGRRFDDPTLQRELQVLPDMLVKRKDQIEQERKQENADTRGALLDLREKMFEVQKNLAERRVAVQEQNAANKAKVGGKVDTPKVFQDNAKAQIKNMFPGITDTESLAALGDAALTVASDAASRAKANPGLNTGQAVAQALLEKLESGELKHEAGGSVLGMKYGSDKVSFRAKPGVQPETKLTYGPPRQSPKGMVKQGSDGFWYPAGAK